MIETILGAGGSIGYPLAKELATYTTTLRLAGRNPRAVNGHEALITCDVTQKASLEAAIAGSGIVYVTVGFLYKTSVWQSVWPAFIKDVTELCLQHGTKMVFIDNIYMYHTSETPHLTEKSVRDPQTKKGAVREEVVRLIESAGARGLTWMIARSADFYGPHNSNSMIQEMVVKRQLKGLRPQWMGRTDVVHTFTYTPDAARAVALLAHQTDTWNQVWHLPTSSEALTGADWIQMGSQLTGGPEKPMTISFGMLKLLGLFIPVLREFPEMLYQYRQPYLFISQKFEKRFPDFQVTKPWNGMHQMVEYLKNR